MSDVYTNKREHVAFSIEQISIRECTIICRTNINPKLFDMVNPKAQFLENYAKTVIVFKLRTIKINPLQLSKDYSPLPSQLMAGVCIFSCSVPK
jgi:hypothetical protein